MIEDVLAEVPECQYIDARIRHMANRLYVIFLIVFVRDESDWLFKIHFVLIFWWLLYFDEIEAATKLLYFEAQIDILHHFQFIFEAVEVIHVIDVSEYVFIL